MSHVGDDARESAVVPRRSSIEKLPLMADSDLDDDSDDESQPIAFDKLPDEIIQQ